MSIEAMKMAWWALCLTNNEAVPDDIEERREAAIEALRQAIEQAEKPAVKSYCGSVPNYCTPEEVHKHNAWITAGKHTVPLEVAPVDAVNMSQERVDETAKREHEPVLDGKWVLREVFIGDEGEPLAHREPPKREWVELTDDEIMDRWPCETRIEFARWVEAKLKEKNGG